MAPELFETMEANRLIELAEIIRAWQEKKGLSTEALIKQLPMLGSSKTFNRVLDNDLKELHLDRQIANFQAAVQYIDDQASERVVKEEEIRDDLYAANELRRAFTAIRNTETLARVIFLLGPSGAGKTSARRALQNRYLGRILLVEATVAWSDSPGPMLTAILRALGSKDIPQSQGERLTRAVELLGMTRRCLIIEEAHHLGPRSLNLVKTLVNQTPGEFVLIAIDTIWRRLETSAYEEARQLTGNRLARRIQLESHTKERDIGLLVDGRLGVLEKNFRQSLVRKLAENATSRGRYAFVRNVLNRVLEKIEGGPVAADKFDAALKEEMEAR